MCSKSELELHFESFICHVCHVRWLCYQEQFISAFGRRCTLHTYAWTEKYAVKYSVFKRKSSSMDIGYFQNRIHWISNPPEFCYENSGFRSKTLPLFRTELFVTYLFLDNQPPEELILGHIVFENKNLHNKLLPTPTYIF